MNKNISAISITFLIVVFFVACILLPIKAQAQDNKIFNKKYRQLDENLTCRFNEPLNKNQQKDLEKQREGISKQISLLNEQISLLNEQISLLQEQEQEQKQGDPDNSISEKIKSLNKKIKLLKNQIEQLENQQNQLLQRPSNDDRSSFCSFYQTYLTYKDNDSAKAIEARNRMIYFVKKQVDAYYNDYKNGNVRDTKWFQWVLDALAISLDLAGTISKGERVKTVISAVAGSFQSGRNVTNERFSLLQQQILINKMNTNRLEQWRRILLEMDKGVGSGGYSWEAARDDLQQYFFRGNFIDALDYLVAETGSEVDTAQETLDIIEGKNISPIPSLKSKSISDEIYNQRIILSDNFSNTDGNEKIISKFKVGWADIEAQKEFKPTIAELKNEEKFKNISDKISNQNNSLTIEDIDYLLSEFQSKISELEEATDGTKLREKYLAILKQINQ